jgi:hypothetical protein
MRSQRLVRERLNRTTFHRAVATLLTDVLKHGEASRYIDELRLSAKLQSSVVDDAWYATFFAAARPEQVTWCEAQIEPDRVLYDHSWAAVTSLGDGLHQLTIPDSVHGRTLL